MNGDAPKRCDSHNSDPRIWVRARGQNRKITNILERTFARPQCTHERWVVERSGPLKKVRTGTQRQMHAKNSHMGIALKRRDGQRRDGRKPDGKRALICMKIMHNPLFIKAEWYDFFPASTNLACMDVCTKRKLRMRVIVELRAQREIGRAHV